MNTEAGKQKSAEAQKTVAPEESDLLGIIKYIEKKEKGLSNYSDKLRQSVEKIAQVFGNSKYCQICNCTVNQGQHAKYFLRKTREYVDALPIGATVVTPDFDVGHWAGMNGEYVEVCENPHKFIQKIQVSVDVEDAEVFSIPQSTVGSYYKLAMLDSELVLCKYHDEFNYPVNTLALQGWSEHDTVGRATLKALVKSGRLQKFLQHVAERLAAETQEYAEVAEIAEKMANVVSAPDES